MKALQFPSFAIYYGKLANKFGQNVRAAYVCACVFVCVCVQSHITICACAFDFQQGRVNFDNSDDFKSYGIHVHCIV